MSLWGSIKRGAKAAGTGGFSEMAKIGEWTGAGKGEDFQQEELRRALDEYSGKNLAQPSVGNLAGKYAGNITSSYRSLDEAPRNTQMDVIAQLQDLYKNGGVDARSTANLDTIRRVEDRQARGARGAIMANQRARGIHGGGLVDQILNATASADRRSAADTQVYGQNEGRAIDALLNSANLAGTVQGQDFTRASALDAIREFNNKSRQAYNARVGDAYQQNYSNRRGVADARANIYGGVGQSRANQYQKRWSVLPNVAGKVADVFANSKK